MKKWMASMMVFMLVFVMFPGKYELVYAAVPEKTEDISTYAAPLERLKEIRRCRDQGYDLVFTNYGEAFIHEFYCNSFGGRTVFCKDLDEFNHLENPKWYMKQSDEILNNYKSQKLYRSSDVFKMNTLFETLAFDICESRETYRVMTISHAAEIFEETRFENGIELYYLDTHGNKIVSDRYDPIQNAKKMRDGALKRAVFAPECKNQNIM